LADMESKLGGEKHERKRFVLFGWIQEEGGNQLLRKTCEWVALIEIMGQGGELNFR